MASDLHTHTNFSDGSFSPEELLATAKNVGLKYLAITDHDTVDGLCHLYENGLYPAKGLNVIPGIELKVDHDREIHIVGYNIDIYNGKLLDKLNELTDARWVRFSEIMKKLRENSNQGCGRLKDRQHEQVDWTLSYCKGTCQNRLLQNRS